MIKYYIIPVYGCTDPESLVGPYNTFEEMLCMAKTVHAKQREEDAIFWLKTEDGKHPIVEAFSGNELE